MRGACKVRGLVVPWILCFDFSESTPGLFTFEIGPPSSVLRSFCRELRPLPKHGICGAPAKFAHLSLVVALRICFAFFEFTRVSSHTQVLTVNALLRVFKLADERSHAAIRGVPFLGFPTKP